jgi:hypothetical protein
LVIEQVLAKCFTFCRFLELVVRKLQFLDNSGGKKELGMKKAVFLAKVFCAMFLLEGFLVGCDNPSDGDFDESSLLSQLDMIVAELVERVGDVEVDNGIFADEAQGIDPGKMADYQYVCNAINTMWNTSYAPVPDSGEQIANIEYLLKMIDMANDNQTSYGASGYATKQVVDKIAVDDAARRLILAKNIFIALGRNSMYSFDGSVWNASGVDAVEYNSNSWMGGAYGNGVFVVVSEGSGTNYPAYSFNGMHWVLNKSAKMRAGSVAYGNDRFVAVGGTGYYASAKCYVSRNGIDWVENALPEYQYWSSIAYGDGVFVVVARNGTSHGNSARYIAVSADGETWTTIDSQTMEGFEGGYSWNSVAYGDDKFVAVGTNCAYSLDRGETWNPLNLSGSGSSVAYGGGRFVAVGTKIRYSENGVDWTEAAENFALSQLVYGGGKFVAIGASSQFMVTSSENGSNWLLKGILPHENNRWYCLFYGGR